MTTVKLLVDGKHLLGEGVLWCERSGRLLWTDILASRLWCHTLASGETQSWAMPEMLATFALTLDDDRLLLGLASQLAWFHFSSGQVTPIVAVEADLHTTRINDGRCDRQGRFVFGTKSDAADRAPNCSFYRLNTDLTLERLPLSPVVISNSICFSPDGATMYYCDTISNTIRCCDYESLDKTVPVPVVAFNNDRLFADLHDQPGSPTAPRLIARAAYGMRSGAAIASFASPPMAALIASSPSLFRNRAALHSAAPDCLPCSSQPRAKIYPNWRWNPNHKRAGFLAYR